VEVSGETTLARLHDVLQAVFEWEDYHLHRFEVGRAVYGIPEEGVTGGREIDDRLVTLRQVAEKAGSQFVYRYDFGDDWEHAVKVEAIEAEEEGVAYPRCTGGKRNGPREDSGGPLGYMAYLEALGDKGHPEHKQMLGWMGPYDGEAFSVEKIDRRLAGMRKRRK
jgi:hypothetical protein